MLEGLDPRLVVKQTPRGGLQAAEYEGAGKGELRVDGKSVVYHDYLTEGDLLTLTYASRREAGLQLKFFRQTYDEVRRRRSGLRLVAEAAPAAPAPEPLAPAGQVTAA